MDAKELARTDALAEQMLMSIIMEPLAQLNAVLFSMDGRKYSRENSTTPAHSAFWNYTMDMHQEHSGRRHRRSWQDPVPVALHATTDVHNEAAGSTLCRNRQDARSSFPSLGGRAIQGLPAQCATTFGWSQELAAFLRRVDTRLSAVVPRHLICASRPSSVFSVAFQKRNPETG